MKRSIGEFLAALRKARGYTQQEVADSLSVSNRTVSAWERGTALPDILLLPALAELYGVTTDEILAGERNSETAPRPMPSQKSENKLLKNKLAKFTAQSLILIGIFLAGALLLYAGAYLNMTKIVWSGWQWWLLLLFAGLVTVVVSAAVLIALFWSAQSSADEDAAGYPDFCILLRRRAALYFYFASGTALLCAFVTCGFLISGTRFHEKLLFLLAVSLSIALAMFLLAFFMNDLALKKWGGENAMARRARNGRLYRKTALFGLIPALLAIVCAIVLDSIYAESMQLPYSVGTFVAGGTVILDIFVCVIVCAVKREKTVITL